jgi:hypothetical protein
METDEVVVNRDSAKKKIGEEEDRSGSKHISDPGTSSTTLGDSDLACLRKKFPFLAEFSDEFIRSRPTETLLKMETTSIKMKELEKGRDIDDKLSTNKMDLEETFTEVKEGRDNRSSILHAARFLAGAACASAKIWRRARQVIGLTGHPPVGSYDLSAVGLAGFVSKKGWVEAANPASQKIRLQQFSIVNCSAKANKKESQEDREGDIQELPEFKLAMRAMRVAFCFVRPWDHSVLAMEGFFEQTQYCEKETAGMDNRAATLTKFVNYCLGQNADRWRDSESYLTTGELVTHWASFVGAMPQSAKAKNKEKKTEKQEVRRKWVDICFPWNSGNCLKAVGDCKSAKGTVLRHVCNYIPDRSKPDVYCGKDHPRTSFHK